MHMLDGVNVKAIIVNQTLRFYFKQEIVQHQPCLTEENVVVKITELGGANRNLLNELSSWCESFYREGNCGNGWEAHAKSWHASFQGHALLPPQYLSLHKAFVHARCAFLH